MAGLAGQARELRPEPLSNNHVNMCNQKKYLYKIVSLGGECRDNSQQFTVISFVVLFGELSQKYNILL